MAQHDSHSNEPHSHEPGAHEHKFPEHNPSVSYEKSEENVRAISSFGIGLAIGIVVVVFAMWALFEWFYAREDRKNPPLPPVLRTEKLQTPPEPRLQIHPRLDIQALREGEDQILSSYSWIDPTRGIVRIPIEEAINLIAAKGLPSQPSPNLRDGGVREIPSKASSGRTTEKVAQ